MEAPLSTSKEELIRLVRQAQAETDPRRREELWAKVQEAGLPADATVLDPVEEHPDMPTRTFLLIMVGFFVTVAALFYILFNLEKLFG